MRPQRDAKRIGIARMRLAAKVMLTLTRILCIVTLVEVAVAGRVTGEPVLTICALVAAGVLAFVWLTPRLD